MREDIQVEIAPRTPTVRVTPSPMGVQDPLTRRDRMRFVRWLGIVLGLVAGVVLIVLAAFLVIRGFEPDAVPAAGASPSLPSASVEQGELRLTVDPALASVMINGRAVDGLENGVTFSVGSYLITARADGYARIDTVVHLRAGSTLTLSLALRQEEAATDTGEMVDPAPDMIVEAPAPVVDAPAESSPRSASLAVSTSEPRARVLIDGRLVGRSPLTGIEVEPGNVLLRIEADGFEPIERRLALGEGEAVSLNETLIAQMGRVRVLVLPWGSILIDGELRHEDTDIRRAYELPVGVRRVRAVHPVLGEIERDVRIEAGRTVDVVIDFNSP